MPAISSKISHVSGFQLATLASTQTHAVVNTNLQKYIYTTQPTQPIGLNVASIQIVNDAETNIKHKYKFVANRTASLFKQVQSQFHESIVELLKNLIYPSQKSSNVAIVRIDEASVFLTTSGDFNFSFLSIIYMAAGHKESFIATIKGVIEIENASGQVIQSMGFDVKGVAKEKKEPLKSKILGLNEQVKKNCRPWNKKSLTKHSVICTSIFI